MGAVAADKCTHHVCFVIPNIKAEYFTEKSAIKSVLTGGIQV